MGGLQKRPAGKPKETFKEWTAEHKRSIPVTRGEFIAWLDRIEQERGLTDLLRTGLRRDFKRLARFCFGWWYRWKVRRAAAKHAAQQKHPLIPPDIRG